MHTTLFDSIRPAARARLFGQPTSALLDLSLDDIEGLSADTRAALLATYQAKTLRGLQGVDLAPFKISAGILDALTCLLLYPKHDPGPDCAWEKLFGAAPLATYQGFTGNPFHTHFGPLFYRGRLDGSARVLVVGQDPATDETLGGRAFVGAAGQLAQRFLARLGVTRSYVMFNTFLYGVQSGSINAALATDPAITAYRNKLFDKAKAANPITLVLAFGSWAGVSIDNWPGLGALPVVKVTHPTAPSGVAANWNSHLATAASHVTPDYDGHVDLTPFDISAPLPTTDIPRRDLPFGTPPWHGTGGGTRSARGSGANFETQIVWTAP